jgi:isopenicillin N synthase-like dioxygenase
MMNAIPEIDVGGLTSPELATRRATAAAIGRACRDIGFLSVVNHGLEGLVATVLDENRRFHAQPLAQKLRLDVAATPLNRGYHPLGVHSTNPTRLPDLKEAFDIALDLPADDPDVVAGLPFHGANRWPDDLPGFRDALERYYAGLLALGRRLCTAFSLDLGVDEDFFADKLDKPLALLRLLHYPPQPVASDQQFGSGAHTDYGCVALLAQDQVGGLQVLRDGAWVDVPPRADALVCNIGEMMERWSNGRYRATPHRVVNLSGRDRYSQVMFLNPNYRAAIAPLPECTGPDDPPRYPPTTMGAFLTQMFNATFKHRREALGTVVANRAAGGGEIYRGEGA